MTAPRLGKFRREIARVAGQISRLHWILRAPLQRGLHDLFRARRLTLTQGDAPLRPEIAVVLLHQPGGLSASSFHMLDHLHAQGLALLVVSNAPLAAADRAQLRHCAWRIMERPNLGYDFGGYRDGILHLLDEGIRLDRLFVINDSVWFPLRETSDLIDRARASDADLYGFALNDARRKASQRHLQSYFLAFSGRLAQHADFRHFWQRLFLSNAKEQVIRRCEIPLTGFFEARGHTVGCRYDAEALQDAAGTLADAELKAVLQYLVTLGAKNAETLRALLVAEATDDIWRTRVLEAIAPGPTRTTLIRAHPALLVGALDTPLLKKTRDARYRAQRAQLLARGLEAGFAPQVRDELRDWDKGPAGSGAHAETPKLTH